MAETMLTPSGVKLYGRIITELHVGVGFDVISAAVTKAATDEMGKKDATAKAVRDAVVKALANKPTFKGPDDGRPGENKFLQKQLRRPDATLARIYSFSYEGQYYELPKPAILLVHGVGTEIKVAPGGDSNIETSGVLAKIWEFSADPSGDLRYWEYDKGDFSIRLEIDTGPFEQILLASQLRGSASLSSGMDLRAGMDLRTAEPRRR